MRIHKSTTTHACDAADTEVLRSDVERPSLLVHHLLYILVWIK